jgi:hypothetical protein
MLPIIRKLILLGVVLFALLSVVVLFPVILGGIVLLGLIGSWIFRAPPRPAKKGTVELLDKEEPAEKPTRKDPVGITIEVHPKDPLK